MYYKKYQYSYILTKDKDSSFYVYPSQIELIMFLISFPILYYFLY